MANIVPACSGTRAYACILAMVQACIVVIVHVCTMTARVHACIRKRIYRSYRTCILHVVPNVGSPWQSSKIERHSRTKQPFQSIAASILGAAPKRGGALLN